MVAGLARSELQTSYKAGVGKVREHTLVLGAQVIAINNIASIRLVESGRTWWLALAGLFLAGGAGTQVPLYGPLAWAGVGLGVLLVLINMLVPIVRGLSIGTSDGRTATIISKDATFLRRLLDLLTEKINSRSEALIGSFDVSNSTVYAAQESTAPTSPQQQRAPVVPAPATNNSENTVTAEPAAIRVPATPDIDDTLFAREPEAPLKPRPAPEQAAMVSVQRASPHDPMLDGPSIAPPRPPGEKQDWLTAPGGIVYEGDQGARSGSLRWMIPVLLVALLAGGGIAAWMVLRNPDGAMTIPLLSPTATGPAESITLADAVAENTAPTLASADAEPTALAPEALAAQDPTAAVDFTPPEPIVARSSGQRFRASPSSADGVPVVAETRFGGEALQINGRSLQSDGEWYRVALNDGRTAWLKASLTVPRARFADTLAAPTATSTSFAAWSPRILEPAEGAQLSGGRQSVRLAWTGNESATAYVVEIQTFDTATQRWTTDPQPRRITIQGGSEIAEAFAAGVWRWRVRGISDIEQSQFSRWSALSVNN